MRHFCSKQASNEDIHNATELIFNNSYKLHKKLIKDADKQLQDSHIDFIKTYFFNSVQLEKFNFKSINKHKLCLHLFEFIVNFKFENEDNSESSYYSKLNKAFASCANSLDVENFKTILSKLDKKVSIFLK